jgi:RNase P/RNase MRP subunit p29
MTDYKYKIGDFVKIIKPKHLYFGTVGRVLKIGKSTLVISREENNVITISKQYV